MIILKTTGGVLKQFPDYIFSTQRVTSVVGNHVTIDGVMYDLTSLNKTNDSEGNTTEVVTEGITDLPFDGNRTIKRSGIPKINPQTDTVKKFIEEYFYPYEPPILSLSVVDNAGAKILFVGKSYDLKFSVNFIANDKKSAISKIEFLDKKLGAIFRSDYTATSVFTKKNTDFLVQNNEYSFGATITFADGTTLSSQDVNLKLNLPMFFGSMPEINSFVGSPVLTNDVVDYESQQAVIGRD